ncbi:cache domain-containing protein [Chryseosolibacter indicus]|uniref:Cache domain-containing protein n=1 Tax=Chryseosolibacter indicus TaxID=2782351 RepID=A0ABS5VPL0_9BACT|nr:cache domain-containing protein [Chryseosolibacter indicus]MBT1703374.1 cache domain-containing protein [Chryseosolibacter indicus]
MKLRQQITLLTSLALLVPAILISTISIYKIRNKAEADIEEYQTEEFNKLKLYLKHITDIAYGIVETRYNSIEKTVLPNTQFRDSLMEASLKDLSKIRFDQGEGYFWVTDNRMPYPTMLMHAENPQLKGVVLDDPKFNVEKAKRRNIYQVRAEVCNAMGDGFVEYFMKKPGTDEIENKISYSRLFSPLGWIVSAGFYTDQIQESVLAKREALNKQINEIVVSIISIAVIILGIGLAVSLYFSGKLTKAIITIKDTLKSLGLGQQVEQIITKRKDEVGEMIQSLNTLVTGLRSYTAFAKEIGQGNLLQEFQPLSNNDVLGNELLEMRENLKKASDEKNERDWFNEGLAKLGEVLRRNSSDTKILADEILRELITYLKVNQGGLFIASEAKSNETRYLEQLSTYAYDRKRFIQTKIGFGEGLIGQCVVERATFHLIEIPKDYISITSGLGHALPQTILIIPLIHNNEVYGAIEMASFQKLQDYEVKFVEKVAESIASTLASVQVNERTRRLLEHSQQMSEELKAQEEELRQNQEELQATQEQMQRRQLELERENEDLRATIEQLAPKNAA